MNQEISNKNIRENSPKSITPSGFFGNSADNIVELIDFMTKEEHSYLLNFAINNKIWDLTESHVDEDGLVLYDHSVWFERVCTTNSLIKSDPKAIEIILGMMKRLKVIVEDFFNVTVSDTGPAIVRWPIGARQEPHADKEFHIGEEQGRANDFPFYDIASLFYLNDDYDGGELYFPLQGLEFKPKPRAAYFFPGDRLYTHGVRPVRSGIRYTSPFFWTITNHKDSK